MEHTKETLRALQGWRGDEVTTIMARNEMKRFQDVQSKVGVPGVKRGQKDDE